ncbi:hypothetical protein MRX96_008599 [Rhipicephalus microplus]
MASSVRRSDAENLPSSDDESESDKDATVVFYSSSEEDSDDVFTDSDSEGEDSSDDTMASSREWFRIDLDNIPARPPRFDFRGFHGTEDHRKETNIEISSEEAATFGMATKVVLKLLEPLLDKGYCVTTDNFYTSPELVDFLLKRSTDIYGTTRATRKDLPPGFAKAKLKKGEMVAFQRGKCLAVQWMDKKLVTVLSTVHSAEMARFIDKMGKETLKPEVILDYNHTMGGVDRADQMLASYSVPRKRKKISYKKIFQHLLDEATYNSFVLYQKGGGRASHLEYRLRLIDEIITKYSPNTGTMKKGRPGRPLNAKRFGERHFPSHIPPTEKKQEPTRRCVVCYMKRDVNGKNIRKETRTWCRWCEKALCAVPCFERYHTDGSLN